MAVFPEPWRRRADSNRRIEVLQTSPLTTWVRRPRFRLAQALRRFQVKARRLKKVRKCSNF